MIHLWEISQPRGPQSSSSKSQRRIATDLKWDNKAGVVALQEAGAEAEGNSERGIIVHLIRYK